MRNKYFFSVLLCTFVLLTSSKCKKDNIQTELDKLPPATQTGANTFGCLVNGKAWIPEGWDGNKPNFFVIADPTFEDGNLSIRTYNISGGFRIDITINSDSIRSIGSYKISDTERTRPILQKSTENLSQQFCEIPFSGNYNREGILTITKYDLRTGIISGTFEFSAVNPDCGFGDTIKITKGRFDYKL